MAMSRLSFVSRARYTSPMPPAPNGDRISYAPRRAPGAKDMTVWIIAVETVRRSWFDVRRAGSSFVVRGSTRLERRTSNDEPRTTDFS